MQFALFSHVPWPEGVDPYRIVSDTTEQVQYGEELGFHGAWFAEHHFSRYGLGSSLVLAAHIAARTSTIRLGTAVLVPPLHHPIRLAEDTAMLDLTSGGRLDVGFGRGSAGDEYHGYNLDRLESQERFQETIRIVQGLWCTPEYSYTGKYCTVNRATLVPPPIQKPHPPLYIAATRTPATLDFVVSTGHPLIIGVVLDTQDALDLCHRFVRLSAAAGHHVPMSRIPFFRYFYVAETEAQALADTRKALAWTLDMIQWRQTFSAGSEVTITSMTGGSGAPRYRQATTTWPNTVPSSAPLKPAWPECRNSHNRVSRTSAVTSPSAAWNITSPAFHGTVCERGHATLSLVLRTAHTAPVWRGGNGCCDGP